MTISELIERLEALKAEHGDNVQVFTESEGMYEPAGVWFGLIDAGAYVRSAVYPRYINAVVI